jgi:hypothetical protein
MGTHLVPEHQAFGVDVAYLHAPESPEELVSFHCSFGSFFRLLHRLCTARQTVASLSRTPKRAARNCAL